MRINGAGPSDDERKTGRSEHLISTEFFRPVREGERERGLQVMQVVLLSGQPLDAEIAELRFAELLGKVIVTSPEAESATGRR